MTVVGEEVLSALVDMLAERLAPMLAERLAPMLAERLAAKTSPEPPELATAKRNPLGSSRAFLDAARRGDFPSYRRGREVVAVWADVLAYERARLRPHAPRTPSPPPTPPPGTDAAREAALRRAGALPPGS